MSLAALEERHGHLTAQHATIERAIYDGHRRVLYDGDGTVYPATRRNARAHPNWTAIGPFAAEQLVRAALFDVEIALEEEYARAP